MTLQTRAVSLVLAAAVAAIPAAAQDASKKKPEAPAAAAQGMPPLPKPGPEHELLKQSLGNWNASVESWMAPGQPPAVSKGTETNVLTGGGLWLVTDFKSEFMSAPFTGHGVMGYDPAKKKYVSTWVDSMTSSLVLGEATYDPAGKVFTGWMEGPNATGKVEKMNTTTELKADGSRVFTIYGKDQSGKETPALRITYTRQK
jgi:hypothetical protein